MNEADIQWLKDHGIEPYLGWDWNVPVPRKPSLVDPKQDRVRDIPSDLMNPDGAF